METLEEIKDSIPNLDTEEVKSLINYCEDFLETFEEE